MLIKSLILSDKSAPHRTLVDFSQAIKNLEIWRPREDVDFVFLCGANIKNGEQPSKRRQDLLSFAKANLPNTKFFLAETIFEVLSKEGHRGNILDIESDLSNFADKIIIVLESESAFCELGAFSSLKQLRNKIIVINDSTHRESPSFINLGPIKAIEEISKSNKILYYRMSKTGREEGDAIGEVFHSLYKLLFKKPKGKRKRVVDFNPNEYFTKESVRFIHDLVYFTGPIFNFELAEIFRILFNKLDKRKLDNHLAFLCSINEIRRTNPGHFKSNNKEPFFEYGQFNIHNLIATFRNLFMKYDYSRLI